MCLYPPEGQLFKTIQNAAALKSHSALAAAALSGKILEARATLCDSDHNLHVDLGSMEGIIPREEGALGIREGLVRDIALITRVGKPVCFKVIGFDRLPDGQHRAILSRRAAQEECRERSLDLLLPGDIIPARITHMEPFGCFVDVGCGISALLPIDSISVSRINHPRDRFCCGQEIFGVVKNCDAAGRITLSHKELLGTWEENAALFSTGETVAGVIRSVENYGVFVELTPNLAGLAEPRDNVCPGQQASVYIKSILRDKMKLKLIIVDVFSAAVPPSPLRYFRTEGVLSSFCYSPPSADRVIQTIFRE